MWIKVPCRQEHQAPAYLGNMLPTGICSGQSHQNRWVTSQPWVRRNYSISTGILLSCCEPELWKHTLPGMEHPPLKKGENGGLGLAYHTPRSSPSWEYCLPCDMHGMHNLVRFLKLPTSLSPGQVGTLCFSGVRSFGHCLCSLPQPGGDYIALKEVPAKFTWQN